MENPNDRKLAIELVPKPLWGNSLYHRMKRSDWRSVRLKALEEYHNVCGICGSNSKPLECHERWEYDDAAYIQKLLGFIMLCNKCHAIKHFGRTNIQAREGRIDIQPIIEHYCMVNNCDDITLRIDYRVALHQWEKRNQFEWTTDFGEYAPMLILPPNSRA